MLLAATAALLATTALIALPARPRLLGALNDAAHAPALAIVALILLRLLGGAQRGTGPGPLHYVLALAAAVAAGAAVEAVQWTLGRDASWLDIRSDALGAACALLVHGSWIRRRRSGNVRSFLPTVLLVAGIAAGAAALAPLAYVTAAHVQRGTAFPTLLDPASPLAMAFLVPVGSSLYRTAGREGTAGMTGGAAIRVWRLEGQWPGVRLDEPEPDWRGYATLNLEVANPGARPLELNIKVHDAVHDESFEDRFNASFNVEALSRRVVTVRIRDIARAPVTRSMDLAHIAGIVVFATTGPATARPGEFLVGRIWLE